MSETNEIIKKTTLELMDLMEMGGEVEIEEKEGAYRVQIDTPETGILIGYHGETLSAFQLILEQIVSHKTGEWHKISVNVGDYMEKREEQLRELADKITSKVLEYQKPETFPFLNSRERRYVHMYLENTKGVRTESVGEKEERRLVVFPSGK